MIKQVYLQIIENAAEKCVTNVDLFDDKHMIARHYFIKGAEYSLSHQWISIREQLPETGVNVLVYDEKLYGTFLTAYLSKRGYWITIDSNEPVKPTHWMYIPDLPL